jgi:hypothetical protein
MNAVAVTWLLIGSCVFSYLAGHVVGWWAGRSHERSQIKDQQIKLQRILTVDGRDTRHPNPSAPSSRITTAEYRSVRNVRL